MVHLGVPYMVFMLTYLMVHDVGICDHHGTILICEGCLPIQHLVGTDAERPPVTLLTELSHRLVTVHLHQHLWADVVWRPHGHVGHGLQHAAQSNTRPRSIQVRILAMCTCRCPHLFGCNPNSATDRWLSTLRLMITFKFVHLRPSFGSWSEFGNHCSKQPQVLTMDNIKDDIKRY